MSSTEPDAPGGRSAEPPDPPALIEAAEHAAAAGDHAAAERLLREAALLQEATLGPLHPDLAHTLNNLGVVCEIADNPVDAEHYFRRACAIATAVLPPDHEFVATSRQNLEDFCAARGKEVKLPAAVSFATGAPWGVPATDAERAQAPPRARDAAPAALPPASMRRFLAPLAVAAVLLALGVGAWLGSVDRGTLPPASVPASTASQSTARSNPDRTPPVAPPEPAPGEAALPRASGARAGEEPAAAATGAGRRVPGEPSARPTPAPVVVAVAQLCRTLSTGPVWRCVSAESPVDSGPLFFYTRHRSPAAAAVQHRWYRGDRVRQVVDLPIRANMLDGYRTYSRQTVDGQQAGDWRVELRTAAGALLHEERFVVR